MEKLTKKYNALVKKKHRLTYNTFVGKDGHAIDMTTCAVLSTKYLLLKIRHFPPIMSSLSWALIRPFVA